MQRWMVVFVLVFTLVLFFVVKTTEDSEVITVLSTAYYAPLPNQSRYATGSYEGDIRLNGTGITKSGKVVERGHIAADWTILPQGTVVHIPGYGRGIVEDIGSAIKGNRIDLFMGYGEEALEEALQWGRREKRVIVVSRPN